MPGDQKSNERRGENREAASRVASACIADLHLTLLDQSRVDRVELIDRPAVSVNARKVRTG
jgi:hypothetical protein